VFLAAMAVPSIPVARAGQNGDDSRPGSVWVVNRDRGELVVWDAKTGDLATPTPLSVGRGAHDICISERAGNADITAETDNAVTIVDIKTLAMQAMGVGPLPHHIEPSHDGRLIYVTLDSHPAVPVPPGVARCHQHGRQFGQLHDDEHE